MTEEKRRELIGRMTLEEKVGMIHGSELFRTKGVERLGIPPFTFSDGPMGVRINFEPDKWMPCGAGADKVTYLPCNTALAATWNREVARKTGEVLGKETRGRGKDMILAPGINIHRTPLCGRNFEYMSEDPCLVSEMVVPLIEGIESYDVSSCVKHFAANSQEDGRMYVNVIADERTLNEIYYPGFKAAVQKAGAKGIMGAYNRVNGPHCCHSDELLENLLRKDWGFTGLVVSDWGGVHDTVEAVSTGMDVEMSVTDNFDNYFFANPLIQAVKEGKVSEQLIDKKIENILRVMDELNMLEGERKSGAYNDLADKETVLAAARESVVLLKNNNGLLPLNKKPGTKILVVGDNAVRLQAPGGGSSEINALYEITPLMGITMVAGGNVKVTFKQGYEAYTSGSIWDAEHVQSASGNSAENGQAVSLVVDERGKNIQHLTEYQLEKNRCHAIEAVKAAKEADVVIYVGGLNHEHDTEGKDRPDMKLPYGQDELINSILEVNKNTVVVMMGGSPVDMTAWLDKADTLVQYYYAGMEGGRALGQIIFGDYSPSGRLPQTFPYTLEDVNMDKEQYPGDKEVNFKEGIFVGYRYYETNGIPVAFPFGYGLSYSSFEYSNLNISDKSTVDEVCVEISLDVKNTGAVDADEVVQVYVRALDNSMNRPVKELRGFDKVALKSGETKRVSVLLDESAFTYYDVNKSCFFAPKGEYEIIVSKNAHEDILSRVITLQEDYTVAR